MTESAPPTGPIHEPMEPVVITGLAALSAFGRGLDALRDGALAARPVFGPVRRFDVSRRRVTTGALLPEDPADEPLDLATELIAAIGQASDHAGLTGPDRAQLPLLLAAHGDPGLARADRQGRSAHGTGSFAQAIARASGLAGPVRAYTSACVAASTAVADAATMVTHGDTPRVMVAAGYLVEADQFAVFDAGRALAGDGVIRPFSAGRRGLILGDGVAAVMVESEGAALARGASILARLGGWGRSGDGYHAVQPRPDGAGLARAITSALRRGAIGPDQVGYVNAHGSGTLQSDAAESRALLLALGESGRTVPVSSTKSLHGQALEASALVELVVTILALRAGALPPNAGFLEPDPECPLNLILGQALARTPRWALSLNAAFGGANTALLVGAA